MTPYQVIPSTTSHKHESLLPALELFAQLGMRDLDLNLNHLVERGTAVDDVRRALAANHQHVHIVSGGWCDFFDAPPQIDETFASVARQRAMARQFGVDRMRLFFGRLPRERYSPAARETVVANICRLADLDLAITFVFENHDGASSQPEVCREILEAVDRPNVRLNFDPINFEHAGVNSRHALDVIRPFIAHVHLKGIDQGEFCEFGAGDVDLTPVIESLIAGGYRGGFTVEYEGRFDRTLRLYESLRRARGVIDRLTSPER